MRARIVLGNVGSVLRLFSYTLLVPMLVAIAYESGRPGVSLLGTAIPSNAVLFFVVFLVVLFVSFLLETFAEPGDFREYEAFVIVGFSWLLITALGALPFVLSGTLLHPLDAFFESMSGFTTTGATVLPGPGSLGGLDWPQVYAPSVLFWRSFTQWLGGLGIIVLAVALLPRLVETGAPLIRAEFSGGPNRLKSTIRQTARVYWGVYLAFTGAGALALFGVLAAERGIEPGRAGFEAITYAFSAISTGGFGVSAASAAQHDSALFQGVLCVVMLLGAISFGVHFHLFRGEPRRWVGDPEVRVFLLFFFACFLATLVLFILRASEAAWGTVDSTGRHDLVGLVRHAAFQAASVQSTTGFASTNYDVWPEGIKLLFVILMMVGGCVGSTAGGIKQLRVLILLQMVRREALRIIHPRSHAPVRLKEFVVEEPLLRTITAFFFAFLAVYIASVVGLSLLGFDLMSSVSAPAAAITSFGPGMGGVVGGPDFTYAAAHPLAKLILIGDMWLGRLEIFAVLLLFMPSTYRER